MHSPIFFTHARDQRPIRGVTAAGVFYAAPASRVSRSGVDMDRVQPLLVASMAKLGRSRILPRFKELLWAGSPPGRKEGDEAGWNLLSVRGRYS